MVFSSNEGRVRKAHALSTLLRKGQFMTKHSGFTKHIDVRLTEAEYEAIVAAAVAHEVSASRFLAERAFTDRLPTPDEKRDCISLIYQLDRIGNNANQIAYGCNYARVTNSEAASTRQEFLELSTEAKQAIRAVKEMARGNS
jgi:hypothetical protein